MKIKLLSAFLLSSLALFAQQNETKKIVRIEGNDTTIILMNSRIDQMDSMLTEEMTKVYISDSIFTRVDVFMDTTILKSSVNGSDTIQVKIGNMKIVILDAKDLTDLDQLKALEGELPKGQRKIIIDERVIIENDEDLSKENWDTDDDCDNCITSGDGNAIWAGIGINANGFMNANKQLASTTELSFLTLDPSKSIGFQFNFAEKRFPIIKKCGASIEGRRSVRTRYRALRNRSPARSSRCT